MPSIPKSTGDISIFISYAPQDKGLLEALERQLRILQLEGLIAIWYDRKIELGSEPQHEVTAHLNTARIILLLISPDFVVSDQCRAEMTLALERHNTGKACTISVLLRPTANWKRAPFGKLPILPKGEEPVTTWHKQDMALSEIAEEICDTVEQLLTQEHHLRSTYRRVMDIPPPPHPKATLLRENVVQEVYTKLIQEDITAIVLTGIAGVGKTTLADQVYHYAKVQSHAGKGPLKGEPLKIKISSSTTMEDIVANLFEVMGKPLSDFSNLAAEKSTIEYLVTELFRVLDTTQEPRLVILDQFEELLDLQGHVRSDRPGVSEWLDLLYSRPCACRFLLTSRLLPQGAREHPPVAYLQEFLVRGLDVSEGIALLRMWGVEASEAELSMAVVRFQGHAYALILLRNLLSNDSNLRITTLLNDPIHMQRFGHMATGLLSYIYTQQLNQEQRDLLLAFSVYREAVPLAAAQTIVESWGKVVKRQLAFALHVLLAQRLLQPSGDGHYGLHPIIADFIREHFVEGNEQANNQVLQQAHAEAARYWQNLSTLSYLPRERRRRIDDVYSLIEAVWHHCCAKQWEEAYTLIVREDIFFNLQRWGGSTILLELYKQLLSGEWQPKRSQEARIHNEIGEVYDVLGQKGTAQQHYEYALRLFRELEERGGEMNTLNNLGAVCRQQGQIERAISYYQEALRICEDAEGDVAGKGITLNNLGKAIYSQGRKQQTLKHMKQAFKYYEQALVHYEQALSLHKKQSDVREEANTLKNIGEVYDTLRRWEDAYAYYEQALSRFRTTGDRRGEGIVLYNLGVLHRRSNRNEEALKCYERACCIFHEIGDRWEEADTLKSLGRLYGLHKVPPRYDVALACCLQAKTIFEGLGEPERGAIPRLVDATLRSVLGTQQFEALLAEVQQQAWRILEQTLPCL